MDGEQPTPFEVEARAIDEAHATGGEINGGELLHVATLEGCHPCCRHRPEPPVSITINVHGSVTSPGDLARIVREQIDQWRRREFPSGG